MRPAHKKTFMAKKYFKDSWIYFPECLRNKLEESGRVNLQSLEKLMRKNTREENQELDMDMIKAARLRQENILLVMNNGKSVAEGGKTVEPTSDHDGAGAEEEFEEDFGELYGYEPSQLDMPLQIGEN